MNHETDVATRLRSDLVFANHLSFECFNKELGIPTEVSGGGSSAKQVADIFGETTNGKPDLYVRWSNGRKVALSLKKSASGQVFLTSVDRFVSGFQLQFGLKVPGIVKNCLELFIGGDPIRLSLEMKSKKYHGPIHKSGEAQEKYQIRLVGKTLEANFAKDWATTLEWFQVHIGKITEFVFARGHASQEADFATHIWYLSNGEPIQHDLILPINRIVRESETRKEEVKVGPKNGGSTIQFPFGFLQMHRPKGENLMQFHHSFKKIKAICE